MSEELSLSANWRMTAAVLGIGWLGSVICFLVFTIGGTTHRLAGIGLIMVMLAGLTTLALLRNLGKVVAEEIDAPGVWEVRLAAASVVMIGTGWILYMTS
jgi:hypothetical protein